VALLTSLNHPNLVRFCGVCLDPPGGDGVLQVRASFRGVEGVAPSLLVWTAALFLSRLLRKISGGGLDVLTTMCTCQGSEHDWSFSARKAITRCCCACVPLSGSLLPCYSFGGAVVLCHTPYADALCVVGFTDIPSGTLSTAATVTRPVCWPFQNGFGIASSWAVAAAGSAAQT